MVGTGRGRKQNCPIDTATRVPLELEARSQRFEVLPSVLSICPQKLCHTRIPFVKGSSIIVYPSSAISNPLYFHLAIFPQPVVMQEHLTYRVAHTFPIPTNSRPTALAINPEGTFLAAGCVSGDIFIWCLGTCDLVCRGSPPVCICGKCIATITSVTWLEDGLLFFARCNGLMGVIRIGKVCWKSSHRGVFLKAFSRDLLTERVLLLMTTYPSTIWHTARSMDFGQLRHTTRSLSSSGDRTIVSAPSWSTP